jgi:hypothetical protein
MDNMKGLINYFVTANNNEHEDHRGMKIPEDAFGDICGIDLVSILTYQNCNT